MLLVGRELSIYLSPSMSLAGLGALPCAVVEDCFRDPASALDTVVERAVSAWGQSEFTRVDRVSMVVGGAYSPVAAVELPPESADWATYVAAATSAASRRMNAPPDRLDVAIDPTMFGLVSVTPVYLKESLRAWACRRKLRMSSMRPLWGIASDCAAARPRSKTAMLVEEPDALTFLCKLGRGMFTGATSHRPSRGGDSKGGEVAPFDVRPEAICRLTFGRPLGTSDDRTPTTFRSCWRVG